MKNNSGLRNTEEIALSIIENAGFRDSRVFSARVVQQMLVDAISEATHAERRIVQHLDGFRAAAISPITLRRAVDASNANRIARLESELVKA